MLMFRRIKNSEKLCTVNVDMFYVEVFAYE